MQSQGQGRKGTATRADGGISQDAEERLKKIERTISTIYLVRSSLHFVAKKRESKTCPFSTSVLQSEFHEANLLKVIASGTIRSGAHGWGKLLDISPFDLGPAGVLQDDFGGTIRSSGRHGRNAEQN